jgi:hypothetical protein
MCKALEVYTSPIKDLPVDMEVDADWQDKNRRKKNKKEITLEAKSKE